MSGGGVSIRPSKRGSHVSHSAPVLVIPTANARLALGVDLQAAGRAVYREIAAAAKGLEIAYLQFVFRGRTLAVCPRIRRDGIVELRSALATRACRRAPSLPIRCGRLRPRPVCGLARYLAAGPPESTHLLRGAPSAPPPPATASTQIPFKPALNEPHDDPEKTLIVQMRKVHYPRSVRELQRVEAFPAAFAVKSALCADPDKPSKKGHC